MLGAHLAAGSIRDLRTDTEFGPRFQGEDDELVEGFVTFETPLGHGRGAVRLVREDGQWVAWTVMTELDDLRGHERAIGAHRSRGPRHSPGPGGGNWLDERRASVAYTDSDPDVVVLGAGQGGLSVAASLRLLGVDTLVIEKNERVGDNWRKRYHSLVLHDPVWADHLAYLPFPDSWPIYTPKDKLGDWFESYASAMELNVWTGHGAA